MSIRRNQRALRTIRNLRFRQKQYNQKIDILCRDIVGAHSEFIEKLSILTFSIQFHESLLGLSDLSAILEASAEFLRLEMQNTAMAVFMLEAKGGYEIHFGGSCEKYAIEKARFENWFTSQVVHDISHSRQICKLENLLALGLQASPADLKHISIAAIPLGQIGKTMGFVLLYRSVETPFSLPELSRASAIMSPLRMALQRCAANTVISK